MDIEDVAAWLAENCDPDLPDRIPVSEAGVFLDEADEAAYDAFEAIGFHATRTQIRPLGGVEHGFLVHFTHDPDAVAAHGLHGIRDLSALGLTFEREGKEPGGVNFAYPTDGADLEAGATPNERGMHYGDAAFVFAARFVRIWHRGDGQEQALFCGAEFDPDAAVRLDYEADWEGIEAGLPRAERREWRVAGGELTTLTDAVERAASMLEALPPAP